MPIYKSFLMILRSLIKSPIKFILNRIRIIIILFLFIFDYINILYKGFNLII